MYVLIAVSVAGLGCGDIISSSDDDDATGGPNYPDTPIKCDSTVPSGWHKLGDEIRNTSAPGNAMGRVAIDHTGMPVLAHTHGTPAVTYVHQFKDGSWQQMGDIIDSIPEKRAYSARIVSAGGVLYTSTVEWRGSGQGYSLFVYRWDGTQWVDEIGNLSGTSVDTIGHELAVNERGQLLVASSEPADQNTTTRTISVRSLASGMPSLIEPVIGGGSQTAFVPNVAIDASGKVHVLHQESGIFAHRRNDTNDAWLPMGAKIDPVGTSDAHTARLAVSKTGVAYVAVADLDTGAPANNVYVLKYEADQWSLVGPTINAVSGSTHARPERLIVDDQNRPVLAWTEDGKLHVARLENGSWQALGAPLVAFPKSTEPVSSASLVNDGCGGLLASFSQQINDDEDAGIHVYRFRD